MAINIDSSNLAVPAELADAGNKVRGIANALAEELNALQAKLAPLEDSWSGKTKVYFTGLEQEWNLSAQGLWGDGSGAGAGEGLLPFIAHALDMLYLNYENAENSNIKTWQMK